MKKIIGSLFLFAGLAGAAGGNFGAGVMVGEPTGFSFKIWTVPQKNAIDLGVGWGSSGFGKYYGYYDDRCFDNGFFKNNKPYCQNQSYNGPDGYYGWRNFHIHGDYLFHNFNLIKSRERFPLYYGPGLAMDYWRGGYYYPDFERNGGFVQLGLRGVVGLAWMPRFAPMDLFLEIAPVLDFYPFTDIRMNAAFGGRFYF